MERTEPSFKGEHFEFGVHDSRFRDKPRDKGGQYSRKALWKAERQQGMWASKAWLSAHPIGTTENPGKQHFPENSDGTKDEMAGEASSTMEEAAVGEGGQGMPSEVVDGTAAEQGEGDSKVKEPTGPSSRQLYMEHLVLLEQERRTVRALEFEAMVPQQRNFPELNNIARSLQQCQEQFEQPYVRSRYARGGRASAAEYRF